MINKVTLQKTLSQILSAKIELIDNSVSLCKQTGIFINGYYCGQVNEEVLNDFSLNGSWTTNSSAVMTIVKYANTPIINR